MSHEYTSSPAIEQATNNDIIKEIQEIHKRENAIINARLDTIVKRLDTIARQTIRLRD